MLSERETALCSAVLALSGTDAMASMIPWPGLDTSLDPAGCLAATNQTIPLVTLTSVSTASRGKCAAIHLHGPVHQRQRRGVSATDVILNNASDCTVATSVSRRAQYPLDSWSSVLVASRINMKLTPRYYCPSSSRAHAFKHLYQNTWLAVDTSADRLLLVGGPLCSAR